MGDVNYTPRTWVASEVVSAAEMNTEIQAPLTAMQAAWNPYTVSWTTTGTAPSIGNGTLSGGYNRVGKTLDFRIFLIAGSTTSFGTGAWALTLPTASIVGGLIFMGSVLDSSAVTLYPAAATTTAASGSLSVSTWPTTAGLPFAGVTVSAPMAWATGDRLTISGRYDTP